MSRAVQGRRIPVIADAYVDREPAATVRWMDGPVVSYTRNSLKPLKNDGWKMSFLLGLPIFRGYVQFQGCKFSMIFVFPKKSDPFLLE